MKKLFVNFLIAEERFLGMKTDSLQKFEIQGCYAKARF